MVTPCIESTEYNVFCKCLHLENLAERPTYCGLCEVGYMHKKNQSPLLSLF